MIILLGMAGAGKSTQCKKLIAQHSFQWLAVGELLRQQQTGDARAEMMTGAVLNDQLVTPIVRAEMMRLGDQPEIVLDGCPRTISQAKWLVSDTETPKVRVVIHLIVSDDEAMRRLSMRGREDDTEDAMRRRFAGYHRDIEPVLSVFKDSGVLVVDIDANQPEEEVFKSITKAIL